MQATVVATLARLRTQCLLFRKSAEELSEGSDDDIAAISIALEIGSLYDDLAEGLAAFNSNFNSNLNSNASNIQNSNPGAAAAAAPSAPAADGRKRPRRDDAPSLTAAEAAAAQAAADRKRTAQAYCAALTAAGQFVERPLVEGDHYFRREAVAQVGSKYKASLFFSWWI